jgi:hypothetical protein
MPEHFTFILNKQAKKAGGDKYICKSNEEFVIYFPQSISRKDNNEAKKELKIEIS